MKKRIFAIVLPLLFGLSGVSNPKPKIVETKAAAANRLLFFEKADVEGLPGWWTTDETFLHYWSSGSGDVHVKMTKGVDNLFTVTIPGTILDSGGGFRFIVHDRKNVHNQTEWNNATTYRDNGHNYFLLTKWNGEGQYLNTVSSIRDSFTATKYRGENVIDTEDVLMDASYSPRFVYQQGYKLEGWYTNSALTTPYVVGKLSGNISLYGKYTAVDDYYVYFRRPDTWGTSINAYYYRSGEGIPLGKEGSGWPGDPMVDVMAGGHGYVIKIDTGYSPNTIIFNDGTNQTDNTPLVANKVYTYTQPEGDEKLQATLHDFEYRLFKSWGPWDDEARALAAHNYDVGNVVTVALKAGDTVKMNISSKIWAPFSKLTGTNVATYFENNAEDGNYKAKLSGVYKFTYNQSFALGAPTATKSAQISADNSTVSFELVTLESEKIAAVNQRLAEINTCLEYINQVDYRAFIIHALGTGGWDLISEKNRAKIELMSIYAVTPPSTGIKAENTTNNSVLIFIIFISLAAISAYFLLKKKQTNKSSK